MSPSRLDQAPFDIDGEIYSESVLLSLVSADGSAGVFTRLARYPSAGISWLWLHVATPAGSWTVVDDRWPCSPDVLDTAAPDLEYPLGPGMAAGWRRSGPRDEPLAARLELALPGPPAVEIDLSFVPRFRAGGTLPGRSEVLGQARARVTSAERSYNLEGAGQWHEQHQSAPRFRAPFTYASLQGEGAALVCIAGPRRAGGFLEWDGEQVQILACDLPAPASDKHPITLETSSGRTLSGEAHIGHAYQLPVYGRAWQGTWVRAELAGRAMCGFVNRWSPDAAAFGS